MELPSAAAIERSVGVVIKYNGDFAEGDGVRRRSVAFAVGVTETVEWNGYGNVCTGRNERDEWTWMTGV